MNDPSPSTHMSLINRVGQREDEARALFAERYRDPIHRWALDMGARDADADDATQEVLLKVFDALQRGKYDRSKGSFRSWLRTVTRNALIDLQRAQSRHARGTGDDNVYEMLYSLEARDDLMQRLEDLFDLELLAVAHESVRARVNSHTWDAYILTVEQNLSVEDAAEKLDIKTGVVYEARHKVKKMLAEAVSKLDP